ncbi:hypothetical protein V1477_017298 [Vespula maculifrons]|uniref:Uncharacterized protein n=1 Tax=Vespula maculifrons TaxID=7453 RepID=A0ABD2B5L9_VESMC
MLKIKNISESRIEGHFRTVEISHGLVCQQQPVGSQAVLGASNTSSSSSNSNSNSSQPVSWSVNRSARTNRSEPANQPASQPTNQPNQPTNKPDSQSALAKHASKPKIHIYNQKSNLIFGIHGDHIGGSARYNLMLKSTLRPKCFKEGSKRFIRSCTRTLIRNSLPRTRVTTCRIRWGAKVTRREFTYTIKKKGGSNDCHDSTDNVKDIYVHIAMYISVESKRDTIWVETIVRAHCWNSLFRDKER